MPASILRKLYIRIIVYLDDFLVVGKTLEETILSNDTVIHLLQNLRICHKLKEISSSPNTGNRILGNNHGIGGDDSVSTSGEDRVDFQKVSGYIVNAGSVNKRSSKAALDVLCKEELNWWISNLRLSNGRSVISHQVELLIRSDASKTGLGAFCQKTSIEGVGSQAEQALHINILELRAAKFAILKFCRYKGSSSPCTNGESSSISLFGKNGRGKEPTHDSGGKGNMGILFSQSDYTYWRIPAGNFKCKGRQAFQGNEKFAKRMDIKQANISETDAGFRTSLHPGCATKSEST